MTTAELDAQILAAPTATPIGIRELAARLGLRVRDIRSRIRELDRKGQISVESPGGGFNGAGERRIALPGEVADVW